MSQNTFELLHELLGDYDTAEAIMDELRSISDHAKIEYAVPDKLRKWLDKRGLSLVPTGPNREMSAPPAIVAEEWWGAEPTETKMTADQLEVGMTVRYLSEPDGRGHARLGAGIYRGYEPHRGDYPYLIEIEPGKIVYLHKASRVEALS